MAISNIRKRPTVVFLVLLIATILKMHIFKYIYAVIYLNYILVIYMLTVIPVLCVVYIRSYMQSKWRKEGYADADDHG